MIRSLLYKFHKWVWDYREDSIMGSKPIASVRENHEADIEGMRFTVMPAEGGTIVQMRTYDRRKDEQNTKTYVIPENESDIAHRVGQIVAMELFKL